MNNLSYDDVGLIADYFDGNSRSDIPTNIEFGGRKFKLPVVPANMKCVIDMDLASQLASQGYFYILHRFYDYKDIIEWVRKMNGLGLYTSISIGVSDKDKDLIKNLVSFNCKVDYLTIDIAHGHSRKMKEMLKYINQTFSKQPYIIAGNVMTRRAVTDLKEWGADCIKVGIGPGLSCWTKLKTGFYSPMFSTIQTCSKDKEFTLEEKFEISKRWKVEYEVMKKTSPNLSFPSHEEYVASKIGSLENIPIIADGGIRHNGDIYKAMVAGASMVMVGGLFSACEDSPADNIYDNRGHLIGKQYYGSASEQNKGHRKNVEGTLIQVDYNGFTYMEKLKEIEEDLQSALSYSGISEWNGTCNWGQVRETEYRILK